MNIYFIYTCIQNSWAKIHRKRQAFILYRFYTRRAAELKFSLPYPIHKFFTDSHCQRGLGRQWLDLTYLKPMYLTPKMFEPLKCEKGLYVICRKRKPRSACSVTQSDQSFRCPLTDPTNFENISMKIEGPGWTKLMCRSTGSFAVFELPPPSFVRAATNGKWPGLSLNVSACLTKASCMASKPFNMTISSRPSLKLITFPYFFPASYSTI